MKRYPTLILLFIIILISACATITPQQQAKMNETVPICYGAKDCEAKWAAARDWILNNIRQKIQIYSNDLIETYNDPNPYSASLSFRVTKKPLGNDSYLFETRGGCNNIFGCVPSVTEAVINFNNYVNSVRIKDDTAYRRILKQSDYTKPKIGIYVVQINGKIIIKTVATGSPAEKSGLKPQDIILQFNGQDINSEQDFQNAINKMNFGENVQILINRNDALSTLFISVPTKDEIQEISSKDENYNIKNKQDDIDIESKLETLNRLLKNGLITEEEFSKKKSDLLENY